MTDGDLLGYDRVGSGARRVVVLNDWMCDTSTWDGARVYLDGERFSWAFADLRGYGRSRALRGAFTVIEAASDVIALADALGWDRFSVVGHSMSTLGALHLAQHRADRVERAVLITPPPPGGFGVSDDVIEGGRALARSDDAARAELLAKQLGDRLTKRWAAHKAARWSATAAPEAVAGYVMMFMRDGVPDLNARVALSMDVATRSAISTRRS